MNQTQIYAVNNRIRTTAEALGFLCSNNCLEKKYQRACLFMIVQGTRAQLDDDDVVYACANQTIAEQGVVLAIAELQKAILRLQKLQTLPEGDSNAQATRNEALSCLEAAEYVVKKAKED